MKPQETVMSQRHPPRIKRHQLPYYLQVFNRQTDQPIGYIGNISPDGLLLISQFPLLVGGHFDMRIKVPLDEGVVEFVDFSATCQWSRRDISPDSYDSGFALVAPPARYLDMMDALRQYFSFDN